MYNTGDEFVGRFFMFFFFCFLLLFVFKFYVPLETVNRHVIELTRNRKEFIIYIGIYIDKM